MIRRLVFILLLLAVPTPALAQLVPIVPGHYTLTWVRHSFPDPYVDPYAEPVIEGGTSGLLIEDTSDPAALGRGLCGTVPYVVGSTPTTGSIAWCFNADGSLDHQNHGGGTWTQYTPTIAVIDVGQGFRGSQATESIQGIALLVPPPPPPPPTTLKVFITQPKAAATVSGTAWIVLWVEGTSGAANTFTLSADGTQIATRTTTARGPVSIPWPTTALPNGTHTLTGTVRDATGNTGTTTMTVIVSNVTNISLTPGTGQVGLE